MGLLLNGNLNQLSRLTEEAAHFCRQHSLGADVESDLNLVLEELFVNSVQHGGCAGMDGAAEVELVRVPGGVELRYGDGGAEFDPSAVAAPDVSAPLEDRALGGMGLHLIRQIVRDFEYHRVGGWNRMRMRRPIPAEGE